MENDIEMLPLQQHPTEHQIPVTVNKNFKSRLKSGFQTFKKNGFCFNCCLIFNLLTILLLLILTILALIGPINKFVLPKNSSFPIKNVVILMLENRSFDNIAGYFNLTNLTPFNISNFCNYEESNNNQSKKYCSSKNLATNVKINPDHSMEGFNVDYFGVNNSTFLQMESKFLPEILNNGYVERNKNIGASEYQLEQLMSSFDPNLIPVTYTLAKEFALFENWYSSIPGPTIPNRAYLHSHTSHGVTKNDVKTSFFGFPQKTFWEVLSDYGITWKFYFQE
ncbi:hypothetical protein HDU92_003410 [Lobulomyces angularis]|nr:hypothetical protein HDU92_003410 [Lobulomyces angularis]